MKKIFLILIAIIFTTNVYAHSTKNIQFDSRANCKKKTGMLKGISKLILKKVGIMHFMLEENLGK